MEKTELVPDYVSEKDVIDEANRRAARAGYCSRSGEPLGSTRIRVGWSRKYADNFERIKRRKRR